MPQKDANFRLSTQVCDFFRYFTFQTNNYKEKQENFVQQKHG